MPVIETTRNLECKIAKSMVKTNQDIIAEQCIINDDGVLAVSE